MSRVLTMLVVFLVVFGWMRWRGLRRKDGIAPASGTRGTLQARITHIADELASIGAGLRAADLPEEAERAERAERTVRTWLSRKSPGGG